MKTMSSEERAGFACRMAVLDHTNAAGSTGAGSPVMQLQPHGQAKLQ